MRCISKLKILLLCRDFESNLRWEGAQFSTISLYEKSFCLRFSSRAQYRKHSWMKSYNTRYLKWPRKYKSGISHRFNASRHMVTIISFGLLDKPFNSLNHFSIPNTVNKYLISDHTVNMWSIHFASMIFSICDGFSIVCIFYSRRAHFAHDIRQKKTILSKIWTRAKKRIYKAAGYNK